MRTVYAHDARVELEPGSDDRAMGAAVTVELCGHWEHVGPCRWPHHTGVAARDGGQVTIRVLFACDASDEREVRRRVVRALGSGFLQGPDRESRWALTHEAASQVTPDEREAAEGLAGA